MTTFSGLERVDPAALERQRVLTDALWTTLCEQGLRNRSAGRIESFFLSTSRSAADSLAAAYGGDGWEVEIDSIPGESEELRIKIVSPEVALTRTAFLELVEVMMIAAVDHGCSFDGFQVNMKAVRRRWWHLW